MAIFYQPEGAWPLGPPGSATDSFASPMQIRQPILVMKPKGNCQQKSETGVPVKMGHGHTSAKSIYKALGISVRFWAVFVHVGYRHVKVITSSMLSRMSSFEGFFNKDLSSWDILPTPNLSSLGYLKKKFWCCQFLKSTDSTFNTEMSNVMGACTVARGFAEYLRKQCQLRIDRTRDEWFS